jgi:hypothetical protein
MRPRGSPLLSRRLCQCLSVTYVVQCEHPPKNIFDITVFGRSVDGQFPAGDVMYSVNRPLLGRNFYGRFSSKESIT